MILILVILLYVVSEARDRSSTPKSDARKEATIEITGNIYFVSPSGDDAADGRSERTALLTLQRAVDGLMPGDAAVLADGEYFQDFVTVRDGTAKKPIIIKGSPSAVVKGSGKPDKIVEIRHSYIALTGFSIDGLGGGDGSKKEHYRDKLVYVEGLNARQGITGLRIIGMHLRNAGGECVRLKYFAKKNEVAHNEIKGCGAYDFLFDGGGKNGEGVYVGTAPEQVKKGNNPTRDVDASDGNWIHDNVIDTQGNECVDIKEGSSDNIVERNVCTGQKDADSGGLDGRGNATVFRENEVFGSAGAGIRVGGDRDSDGIGTLIMSNYLHDNANGGIKVQAWPQGKVCGNRFENNANGDIVGKYASESEDIRSCDD